MPVEVQTATDGTAKEIKSFLGAQRFAEYESFTETLGYRVSLGKARERMAAKGVPLTREQEEFLIDVMRDEDAHAGSLELSAGGVGHDNEAFSAEALTRQVEERDQRILKRAGGRLSAEQLDLLAAAQSEDREVMALSATIGQTMAEGLFPGLLRDAAE